MELLTAFAFAALQKNAVPPPYERPEQTTPNVVVIYTDDQGYSDVGVYGAEGFETPKPRPHGRRRVCASPTSTCRSRCARPRAPRC